MRLVISTSVPLHRDSNWNTARLSSSLLVEIQAWRGGMAIALLPSQSAVELPAAGNNTGRERLTAPGNREVIAMMRVAIRIQERLHNTKGQTMTEYAMILAAVAVVVFAAYK